MHSEFRPDVPVFGTSAEPHRQDRFDTLRVLLVACNCRFHILTLADRWTGSSFDLMVSISLAEGFEAESNLEHTQFRQLSSAQGRWLSPDPYLGSMDLTNPQSLNRYAYVMNSH